MTSLVIVYVLASLALVGVGIYEHINGVALSLPIPRALSILTTTLPIIAAANALFLPRLLHGTTPSRHWRLAQLIILQSAQAMLTTVLATLLASSVIPSDTLTCSLATAWQRLFSAHNADSIRRIQDSFDCCGLNSVRDRAWPWRASGVVECPDRYSRSDACAVPWRNAMQRTAGVELGVVLIVGILQVSSFFLIRHLGPSHREGSWADLFQHPRMLPASSRRLLAGQDTEQTDVEEHSDGAARHQGYGAIVGREARHAETHSRVFPEVHNDWGDGN